METKVSTMPLKFIATFQSYVVTQDVIYVIVKVAENIGHVMNSLFQYTAMNKTTISGEETDGSILYWSGTRSSLQLKLAVKKTIGIETTLSSLLNTEADIELREGNVHIASEQANTAFVALIQKKIEKIAKIMYLRPKEASDGLMAYYGKKIDWSVATEVEAQEFYAFMHMYAYCNDMDIGAPDREIVDMYKQIARKERLCVVCRSGMFKIIGTMPLCTLHVEEYNKLGDKGFKEKYYL